jgi:hypothetical protein
MPHSQSQSQSYFTTRGLPAISSSWCQAPWDPRPVFFYPNTCCFGLYVTISLTRRWVCPLKLLLALARAVILRSESRGTDNQILLSQIRDSPDLEGQVLVFISPRNRAARLYPQALGSLFIASYDSQGYGGGIRTRLRTGVAHFDCLLLLYSVSVSTETPIDHLYLASMDTCIYNSDGMVSKNPSPWRGVFHSATC